MKTHNLTIPTLLGTEKIVAGEVQRLGYETSEVRDGAVTFTGDAEAICLAIASLVRSDVELRTWVWARS